MASLQLSQANSKPPLSSVRMPRLSEPCGAGTSGKKWERVKEKTQGRQDSSFSHVLGCYGGRRITSVGGGGPRVDPLLESLPRLSPLATMLEWRALCSGQAVGRASAGHLPGAGQSDSLRIWS